MKLSDEVSQKFYKVICELPDEKRGTIEATDEIVALVKAELEADPSQLWVAKEVESSDVQEIFLRKFRP